MEQINLNIIPDGVMPVCHASQFDKNRTIRFNLNQNGSVYTLAGTETITCKVRKPDDTESTINVANTSSSYVDVTFGFSDTDLSGYAMCELKIVKGTQTIGSRNFLLNIEADAFDGSKFEERSASGAIASFETNYIDNLNELIVNITATQAGSGTPSPSNPRAISGWSECDVTRCGKNILEPCIASGTVNGITYTVNDDGTIKLSNTATSESKKWGSFDLKAGSYIYTSGVIESFDTYDTYLSISGTTIARGISGYNSFTLAQDSTVELTIRVRNGITPNITIKPMIRLPDTSSDFEPYNGGTDTISLGQTVYGGTLNVSTGLMTITHGYIDLGVQTWFSGGGNFYDTADIGAESSTMDIISTSYPCESSAYFENHPNIVGLSISASRKVRFYNSDATSPSDVQTLLNGCYLCYKLATPTEITLAPTEVRTLLENNNIFADTGDVVSCKYLVEVT